MIVVNKYSLLVKSLEANDLIWVNAEVIICDEPESNYLEIKELEVLAVENNLKLTELELEEFKKKVLDNYVSYRQKI